MTSSDKKAVAIHQPDFFPWLGFFDKVHRADQFIVLDHVVNNPKDGIWTRRVKIVVNGSEHWLTVPVKKSKKQVFIPIKLWEINDSVDYFPEKLIKTVFYSYKSTPFFQEIFPLVEGYFHETEPLLIDRNLNYIKKIMEKLNIDTPMVRSSTMDCQLKSTELLVELVQKVSGSIYIPGGGAALYQQDDLFARAGIKLQYQNFEHPVYKQFNTKDFIPGLSILDPLMNLGFSGVEKLIKYR